MRRAALILSAFVVYWANMLQGGVLYHPRPYPSDPQAMLPPGGVEIHYQMSFGEQTAFYIPPQSGKARQAAPLWVMFGGNASLALDWLDLIESIPDKQCSYLLIDYPGYGECKGRPSAERILESTEAAMNSLAEHLGVARGDLEKNLNVLGHSLGAAAALQFAAGHPVRKVVLVAPFTSFRDMAKVFAGAVASHLVSNSYNNRARLGNLAGHSPRPHVTIVHGDSDEVIPVAMGRELAGMTEGWGEYHEIAGAGHNDVVAKGQRVIVGSIVAGTQPAASRAPRK